VVIQVIFGAKIVFFKKKGPLSIKAFWSAFFKIKKATPEN
jgi:hypothetical protein